MESSGASSTNVLLICGSHVNNVIQCDICYKCVGLGIMTLSSVMQNKHLVIVESLAEVMRCMNDGTIPLFVLVLCLSHSENEAQSIECFH